MTAGGMIGVAPDHHELSGRSDIAPGARLKPPQVLQEREQNKTARQDEAFGEALQLLMRRQRQNVEIAERGGVDGA